MEIINRLLKLVLYAIAIPLYLAYYLIDFLINTVRWVITGKRFLPPLIVYILSDDMEYYIKEF